MQWVYEMEYDYITCLYEMHWVRDGMAIWHAYVGRQEEETPSFIKVVGLIIKYWDLREEDSEHSPPL